jgi:hypothetical protein
MRTHRLIRAFGVGSLLLAASGCATTALLEQELVKTNTQTVLAFEETVFNKHEVQEAFRHYIGEGFIEHDPRLAGTPGRGVGNGLGPSAQAAVASQLWSQHWTRAVGRHPVAVDSQRTVRRHPGGRGYLSAA